MKRRGGQQARSRRAPCCRESGPGAFTCSLKPGHGGDSHVAKGIDGQVLAAWSKADKRRVQ